MVTRFEDDIRRPVETSPTGFMDKPRIKAMMTDIRPVSAQPTRFVAGLQVRWA